MGRTTSLVFFTALATCVCTVTAFVPPPCEQCAHPRGEPGQTCCFPSACCGFSCCPTGSTCTSAGTCCLPDQAGCGLNCCNSSQYCDMNQQCMTNVPIPTNPGDRSGDLRWVSQPFPGVMLAFDAVLPTSQRIVVLMGHKFVAAVQIDTAVNGQMLWNNSGVSILGSSYSYSREQGILTLSSGVSDIIALNATTGQTLWSWDFPGSGSGSSDSAASGSYIGPLPFIQAFGDVVVVVGAQGGDIFGLHITTGMLVYQLASGAGASVVQITPRDLVVALANNSVWLVRGTTGAIAWQIVNPAVQYAGTTLSADFSVMFVVPLPNAQNIVVGQAISLASGSVVWSTAPTQVAFSNVFSVDSLFVAIIPPPNSSAPGQSMLAYDIHTGAVVWTQNTTTYCSTVLLQAVKNDNANGPLAVLSFCDNPVTGETSWTLEQVSPSGSVVTAPWSYPVAYLDSQPQYSLARYHSATSNTKQTELIICYSASSSNYVVALDVATGTQRWVNTLDTGYSRSGPNSVAGRFVLLLGEDDRLYLWVA